MGLPDTAAIVADFRRRKEGSKMLAQNSVLGLLLTALTIAPAAAQVITVTPTNPVPGQTVDVGYSNPNMPNQIITITITFGNPAKSTTLSMLLDNAGNGGKQFIIPNAPPAIRFNGPSAPEVVIFIL